MEQENKINIELVEKFFQEHIKYINKLYPLFELEIRKKDKYIKNDIQLIGYYSDINLSLFISYDINEDNMIYELEHHDNVCINRCITIQDSYNYIFLLSDIVKEYIRILNLCGNNIIHTYNSTFREYKIQELIS
jgi:hypothetical protein